MQMWAVWASSGCRGEPSQSRCRCGRRCTRRTRRRAPKRSTGTARVRAPAPSMVRTPLSMCARVHARTLRGCSRARVCVRAHARVRTVAWVCVRICARSSVSVRAGVWVSAHLKSHADGREPNRDLHKPLCTISPCCNVSTRGCNVRLTALGCVAAYYTVALSCLALQHSLRHSCSQCVANCMPLQLRVALRWRGAYRSEPVDLLAEDDPRRRRRQQRVDVVP